MPKGARVSMGVLACDADGNVVAPVGWVSVQWFDWHGVCNVVMISTALITNCAVAVERMVSGDMQLRLWPGAVDPIGTCTENFTEKLVIATTTRLLEHFTHVRCRSLCAF